MEKYCLLHCVFTLPFRTGNGDGDGNENENENENDTLWMPACPACPS